MKVTIAPAAVSTERDLYSTWENVSISQSVLSLIPYTIAIEYFVLPFGLDEKGRMEVLMADPSNPDMVEAVQMCTGRLIKPTVLSKDFLLRLIAKHYDIRNQSAKPETLQKNIREPGAIPRLTYNRLDTTIVLINDILHEAIRLRASDIHMEPYEREMRIRFRIDGILQEMLSIPADRIPEATSRVKIMARLDIAEKRRSQDGRISITEHGKDVDIRVSTLPTDFGEKIVLRLLDKKNFDFQLETIGMEQNKLALFKKAIELPNGIVLITGPTGSGKTTTLYGAINYLKKPGVNISTIEDPIEYNIPGVNQAQVKPEIDMTFAHLLRTLLRQDPNIIMVGEMRDEETAQIAIRSSLTGHLVLSTLHTNDAPSAITRLLDMDIESYLVASSVTMIVAQRLVRKICSHCACEEMIAAERKKSIGLSPDIPVFKGLGCSACGHTGYRGRTGVFEILPITEEIRTLINNRAYAHDIRNRALQEGLVSLREAALSKLADGITSFEEVLREISVIV